jgi:hypothetical protein
MVNHNYNDYNDGQSSKIINDPLLLTIIVNNDYIIMVKPYNN